MVINYNSIKLDFKFSASLKYIFFFVTQDHKDLQVLQVLQVVQDYPVYHLIKNQQFIQYPLTQGAQVIMIIIIFYLKTKQNI